jgi:hypothetical protein
MRGVVQLASSLEQSKRKSYWRHSGEWKRRERIVSKVFGLPQKPAAEPAQAARKKRQNEDNLTLVPPVIGNKKRRKSSIVSLDIDSLPDSSFGGSEDERGALQSSTASHGPLGIAQPFHCWDINAHLSYEDQLDFNPSMLFDSTELGVPVKASSSSTSLTGNVPDSDLDLFMMDDLPMFGEHEEPALLPPTQEGSEAARVMEVLSELLRISSPGAGKSCSADETAAAVDCLQREVAARLVPAVNVYLHAHAACWAVDEQGSASSGEAGHAGAEWRGRFRAVLVALLEALP